MLTRRRLLKSVLSLAILPMTGTLFAASVKRKTVEHKINIQSFAFESVTLTLSLTKEGKGAIRVGDTITWINQDIVPHTATAADNSWDTGLIEAGAQVSLRVTQGWVSEYYCIYHPKMVGKLGLVSH
ncbi:MAG: plastocyanin [Oceanospirillaceae bacterium]|jgi:plastocyanin